MGKQPMKLSRAGAYIVKAAESRPTRIAAKSGSRTSTPSGADKRLAQALLKAKRA